MRRRVGMRNAQPIAYPGTNATTTAKSSSGIVANQLINPHLTTVNALKPLVRGPGALSCTKQGYLRGLYTPEKPPEDPRKTRLRPRGGDPRGEAGGSASPAHPRI